MNELQRQAYLSSLGIENYMPRWQLPFAPIAIQSDVSLFVADGCATKTDTETFENSSVLISTKINIAPDTSPLNLLQTDLIAPVSKPVKISSASILQQLEKKPQVVEVKPFALSVWRPAPGFLVIDSRQAALALPTEIFLCNILSALIRKVTNLSPEEVLRWPMVENRFVSHTLDHARAELQTWLTVEHEQRSINQLWLMGQNAARYLLPADIELEGCLWKRQQLAESGLTGLVLPSLNELLQQPQLKAQLWAAIQ